MLSTLKRIVKEKRCIIYAVKVVLCAYIIFMIGRNLFVDGLKPYISYKDYDYQNEVTEEQAYPLSECKKISQSFTAKGNHLDNVSVYLGDTDDSIIYAAIYDENGNLLADTTVNLAEYAEHTWNKIGLSTTQLKTDGTYSVSLSCDSGLSALYCSSEEVPEIFGGCTADDTKVAEKLAVGFQFTHTYLTPGNFFEIVLKVIYSVTMYFVLCFTVWHGEEMYDIFRKSERKKGCAYALYLSGSLSLLDYPLHLNTNAVTKFYRVIGTGLIANRDVSKRIANFRNWFVFFAVTFVLFYLFANYFIQKEKRKECKNVESFLNHFMILADCSLMLRCMTFFNDKAELTDVYYFSSYVIMMVVIAAGGYVLCSLDRKISADDFAKLSLVGVCLSIPLSIFAALEWDNGKVLLGICGIVMLGIFILCMYGNKLIGGKHFQSVITTGVLVLSFIPLCTSCYIELVHVLNQYQIFIAYPAKVYKYIVFIIIIIWMILSIMAEKKNNIMHSWRKWVFPCFVFGVSCLSVQIPITSIYDLDLFERANSGVLISDFLNYGKIPLVQHYGGHMMSSVWEGILYGIINNDYAGAALSPYSVMIVPILALLFYYFVSMVWDRDIAVFVVLLCPFYNFWNYYGLGMLVCLAAVAFVKKNTYIRAALLWAAVIWCVTYRLDLGFAFGIAVTVSLAVYLIMEKEWATVKKLGLTFIGWGITGCIIWVSICLIKGINPVNRLREFLMISLSNQNWAYKQIGTTTNALFGWTYMCIPCLVAICLVYTIFSEDMRKKTGKEKWVILMMLGLAYCANFSRGLVRHSLAEMTTYVVSWSSYLFLAYFVSCFFRKRTLFLPLFLLLNLCNEFLIDGENYTKVSIADNAVSASGTIIDSWEPDRFANEGELTYWEELKRNREVVNRVELAEDIRNYADKYKVVLDILLEDEDTFVDYINKTMLYPILGKENPVYVSQSPLQLSGEFTQKEFIKEMDGIDIILMPMDENNYKYSNSMDDIANSDRNYKVSEYIYQHYMPVCRYGNDYAVWCFKENYEEYIPQLSELINRAEGGQELYQGIESISYGYDGPIKNIDENGNACYEYIGAFHKHYLERLPGIWAEYDLQRAINNRFVTDLEYHSGMYLFDSGVIGTGEMGNYLKVSATYDGTDEEGHYGDDDEYVQASIVLGTYQDGEFIERYRYVMSFEEGTHDYLIRCSTDYYWYLGLVNAVKIEANCNFRNVSMQILEGD